MSPEKDPSNYPWIVWAWVFGLSLLGGTVNYANRVSKGLTTWRNIAALCAELLTSVFVGLLTFLLCEWQGFSSLLTAALVGVSAHMGTRALFQLEIIRNRLLNAPTPKE